MLMAKSGQIIASAACQHKTPAKTTSWTHESDRNGDMVTFRWDIFTFTDPDSPYSQVIIRWGIMITCYYNRCDGTKGEPVYHMFDNFGKNFDFRFVVIFSWTLFVVAELFYAAQWEDNF